MLLYTLGWLFRGPHPGGRTSILGHELYLGRTGLAIKQRREECGLFLVSVQTGLSPVTRHHVLSPESVRCGGWPPASCWSAQGWQ